MGAKQSLQDTLFNLKMTSKQLKRMSTSCEKNEAIQKRKAVEAMSKGNLDTARVYAANAIREKSQALNFLKLSSRIDGVASRVESAVKMNTLTAAMSGVVDGMDVALKSMDTAKIAKIMDKFESQFESVDVRTSYMDAAMDGSLSTTTPMDQVDGLMMEIGSEANLNVADLFVRAGQMPPTATHALGGAAAAAAPAGRTAVALGSTGPAPAPAPAPAGPPPPHGGSGGGGPAGGAGGGGGGGTTESDLSARLAALRAK